MTQSVQGIIIKRKACKNSTSIDTEDANPEKGTISSSIRNPSVKLEIALGFGMHYYDDITVEYSDGGKCNNAPLLDTIRLGNLRRALHDLKVVGYTNTLHSEYDQEPNNTNNIVGDFNNSHDNIRKYCEDNDALIKLCVVDYNRMPSAYSTPLYTNIESQLISMK